LPLLKFQPSYVRQTARNSEIMANRLPNYETSDISPESPRVQQFI